MTKQEMMPLNRASRIKMYENIAGFRLFCGTTESLENVAAGVKFNQKKNSEKLHVSTSINKKI